MADTWDRHSSPQGAIDLIACLESLRLEAYRDSVGKLTIGFGSTFTAGDKPIHAGDTITRAQALEMLEADVASWAVAAIRHSIIVPMTQAQASALCSFVYNLGPHSLPDSTLAEMMGVGQTSRAAKQFGAWVMAGGHPNLGLMRRRELERRVFFGAPLHPTYEQVWKLNESQLLPLYESAVADEKAWRAEGVHHVAPVVSHETPSGDKQTPLSLTDDQQTADLNAAEAAGTLNLGKSP